MKRIKNIHFVGIGGSGMGGIAEVMFNMGYKITGSDIQDNEITQRLHQLGIAINIGHDTSNLGCCDVVVTSTAISKDNPELIEAHKQRIPVIPRAEMLAELMRFRYGIAIAGTHGKTTTTSLTASLLAEAGLDPTFVIGGRLNSTKSNACLGAGEYLVAEADESDASFLHLQPMMAVITNIDNDHLRSYDGDFDKLCQSFIDFIHQVPFYGLVIVCTHDPVVKLLLPRISRPVLTYGLEDDADVWANHISQQGTLTQFTVHYAAQDRTLDITLNMAGEHNVLNALAAIAVAFELGITDKVIKKALRGFQGVERRLQVLGEMRTAKYGKVLLIDDYGHHPCEVAATLQAIRDGWMTRRLVVIFQPHRYTRTHDLYEDFVRILSTIDVLILLDVYSAGEQPIAGADSRALSGSIRARGHLDPIFVADHDELPVVLDALLQEDDILLTLGAGSIGQVAKQMLQFLGGGRV